MGDIFSERDSILEMLQEENNYLKEEIKNLEFEISQLNFELSRSQDNY